MERISGGSTASYRKRLPLWERLSLEKPDTDQLTCKPLLCPQAQVCTKPGEHWGLGVISHYSSGTHQAGVVAQAKERSVILETSRGPWDKPLSPVSLVLWESPSIRLSIPRAPASVRRRKGALRVPSSPIQGL